MHNLTRSGAHILGGKEKVFRRSHGEFGAAVYDGRGGGVTADRGRTPGGVPNGAGLPSESAKDGSTDAGQAGQAGTSLRSCIGDRAGEEAVDPFSTGYVLGDGGEGVGRAATQKAGDHHQTRRSGGSALEGDQRRSFPAGTLHGPPSHKSSAGNFSATTASRPRSARFDFPTRDNIAPTRSRTTESQQGAVVALTEKRGCAVPPETEGVPRRNMPPHPSPNNGVSDSVRRRSGTTEGGRDGNHVAAAAGSHVKYLLQGKIPGVPWIPGEKTRYNPEDEKDMGPGLEALYNDVLAVSVNGKLCRPPRVRGIPEDDYIAPICAGFMDMRKLQELDVTGELQGVIDLITDPKSFYTQFLEGALENVRYDAHFRKKISRNLMHHLKALKDYNVLEEVDQEPTVVLHGFTVEKKSGGRRFVLDGRKLNDCMRHPPDMWLPRMPQVIHQILQANWVVNTDGKSWFYQFPVHPDIRDFFGVKVAPQRGKFVTTRLKALCMGWKFAPCIANRAARVLLPPSEGVTWIDNFIVTADTEDEATKQFQIFISRCNAVDAKMTLDEKGYGVPTQLFETFGVSFDLRHHIYRSDPEWIKKFLANSAHAKVTGGMATPREIYKVVGGMVWHSYITNSFLCFLPATLSFMRDIARDLYNTAAWDTPTAVRPSVVKEVKERTIRIKENPWIERGPTSSITAWSDASSKAWAAILESEPQQVSQADFSNEQEHWHIYRKELYAAKQAVALAARSVHTTRLRLMVDNLPAVHSLQRGHSSDYRSNFVIAELFTLAAGARIQVACEWVPTLEQRADKYTRGVVADYPITLPV